MIKLNKKGGEKIFSIWWFLCLIFIGVAVFIVLNNYFGVVVDVRAIEVNQMYEKIMDCSVKNGFISEVWKEETDFFEFCKINKNSFGENSKFLLILRVYNESDYKKKEIRIGDLAYEEDCLATAGLRARYYPVCAFSNESALYFNEETLERENWKINLIVASNNAGRKISIVDGKTND
jgi:hypothetical protein